MPSWDSLCDSLRSQFAPISEVQLARDKLAVLKQTKGVNPYAYEFRRLILLLPVLPDAEYIDRFIRGLKIPVSREVTLREPTTLDEAIRIAERYDTMSWNFRDRQPSFRTSLPTSSATVPVPMDIGAIRFKKLTSDERTKIMDNNGCLYCRKLNVDHRAKNCPSKRSN